MMFKCSWSDVRDSIYVGNAEEDIIMAKKQVLDVKIDRKKDYIFNSNPSLTIKSFYELKKFF